MFLAVSVHTSIHFFDGILFSLINKLKILNISFPVVKVVKVLRKGKFFGSMHYRHIEQMQAALLILLHMSTHLSEDKKNRSAGISPILYTYPCHLYDGLQYSMIKNVLQFLVIVFAPQNFNSFKHTRLDEILG